MEYLLVNVLLQLVVLRTAFTGSNSENVRLCGNDYTTPGRCIVTVAQSLDWHDADDHCKENLPKAAAGHLVGIENQATQDLVASEVQKLGWDRTWINGCLKDRFWFWQRHWKWLSFQGCWQDYDNNYDLPIKLNTSSNTKPSDCLQMCKDLEKDVLSVQRDANGKLMCRCGKEYGKHGRSYDPKCDRTCPGTGGLSGGEVINQKCGDKGYQLIYYTGDKGTPFHAWAQIDQRTYDNCAVFDHNLNHKWAEHSCFDQLPFICDYDINENACTGRSGYLYVSGVCITIENTPKDFYEAQAVCGSYNAELLMVTNAGVYNDVVRLLDSSKSYFFALSNEEWVFSYWQLIYRYFNWGANQPAEGKGQDCFMMKQTDKKWYNIDCDTPLPFVCMVDISEREETTLPPSTSTTTQTNVSGGAVGDDGKIGGISKDLIIGIGAGAGGALVLAILVALCICCCLRQRNQKAERKRKRTGKKRPPTAGRQLPPTPCPKPSVSSMSNRAYTPDLVQDHPGRGRHGTSRSTASSGRSDTYDYANDVRLREYEELDQANSQAHPYDKIRMRNEEYLYPVESVRRH